MLKKLGTSVLRYLLYYYIRFYISRFYHFAGHVKPNQEPLIIMVIYRPLQYISLNFQIQIFITNLCKTPYIINFYAYTRPGILR